ncbi:MAG: glycosyltransferase family 4 protein [Halobacteriaceae archaeon]
MATPYTVYHPLAAESMIAGGVGVSASQQRTALEKAGVSYTGEADDDYDLVHLNFLGPTALRALTRARRADMPVVVHAHSLGDNVAGTYRFSNALAPLIRRYYGRIYRAADTVIAVSEATRERLRDRGIQGPIPVVSNGVDTEALDGRPEAPKPPDGPTVVNLAQVYDIKGVKTFIDVGTALPEASFRWWGHRHPLLAPRATKRRVERAPENVAFPGFIDDKRAAFAAADVFFSPTHLETQGLSVLEAAYCGLPIVVRDIPVFEYLTHGETCLKGTTTAELTDAVQRLLEDPELRTELGEAARDWVADHTLETVGQELRRVYEDTLLGAH